MAESDITSGDLEEQTTECGLNDSSNKVTILDSIHIETCGKSLSFESPFPLCLDTTKSVMLVSFGCHLQVNYYFTSTKPVPPCNLS